MLVTIVIDTIKMLGHLSSGQNPFDKFLSPSQDSTTNSNTSSSNSNTRQVKIYGVVPDVIFFC